MTVANCGASGGASAGGDRALGASPATDTKPPLDGAAGGGVVLGRGRVISRLSPAASVFKSVGFSFSVAEASLGEHQVNLTVTLFFRTAS